MQLNEAIEVLTHALDHEGDEDVRNAIACFLELLDPTKAEEHTKVLLKIAKGWFPMEEERTHSACQAGAAALSLVPKLEGRVTVLRVHLEQLINWLDSHKVELATGTLGDVLAYTNILGHARAALEGENDAG